MDLEYRIQALLFLGKYLKEKDERLNAFVHRTHHRNKWFTHENQYDAMDAIANEFLEESKLRNWVKHYNIPQNTNAKKIGMIPAANIPMVWFHDVLSIFINGHHAVVKLSERDEFILPYLVKRMNEEFPGIENLFTFPDNLQVKELDAVIATGSNNSSRYFDYYFSKIKNIIRRNRSSIAIIQGDENKEELVALGKDITQYYGLGCRNVSKIYVPKDYDFTSTLEALHEYKEIILHDKYKNNYDYNTTMLILNKIPYWNSGSVILAKLDGISSPISMVHYEEYESLDEVEKTLLEKKEEIQCIVSKKQFDKIKTEKFGDAQSPSLFDYADGVDTMEFLLGL